MVIMVTKVMYFFFQFIESDTLDYLESVAFILS